MSAKPEEPNVSKFEIGHVLFLDMVGYSKLLIEEQKERLRKLTEVVLATSQVAKSTNEQLVRLPTGDGMALVFRNSSEEPARCALEIAQALKAHPEIAVRMGIHSGPVSEVTDLNDRTNIAGAGINMAQRVMDCGDAGHILLSQRVAEDLSQLREWREQLHELGECEVKHGVRIAVVNLCTEEIGNPQMPAKLSAARRRATKRRSLQIAAGTALIVLLMTAIVLYSLGRRNARPASNTVLVPDKSVAVLPFENLSREPDNAYFADGVQDEILTDLAKIGDLKVISRTSVMQYKSGIVRNLREIGKQLGVAHLLEGSVQRAGNKVRVNAQLINARTDTHEWAENYDRPLDDVFAIQSQIAKTIADQLQAKIAPAQLAQIERKPTSNLQAYDAYLRGIAYSQRTPYSPLDTSEAIKHFREATRLDPAFADAWAELARALLLSFFNDPQSNPATLQAGREAAKKAYDLQPASAEANLAQGYLFYYGEHNYEEATRWFEKALKLAPGNANTSFALALISRRTGKWQERVAYSNRAAELNPRATLVLAFQWETLLAVRDYPNALKTCDALLNITPDDKQALSLKITVFQDRGDLKTAAALLPPPGSDNPNLFLCRVTQLTYERRYQEAIAACLARLPKVDSQDLESLFGLDNLAFLYYLSGDLDQARVIAQRLRRAIERDSKGNVHIWLLAQLAEAYALIGDKENAIEAAQRLGKEKDASFAIDFPYTMAEIGVLCSDREMALKYLALAARSPGPLTYGELKFSALWDPLRGDPRFDQIVASLAPK
jgi:TolB-like protein/class 3 adenylate cyclase/Flp pilus assembly protein TadD